MITLGIDLASQPKKTAACVIDWAQIPAQVQESRIGLDDDDLLKLIEDADKVGIDAPFGWPQVFVQAVSTHAELGPWPDSDTASLRFRHTDFVVADKARRPLSVTSDRIAVTAMRCARLITKVEEKWGPVDRAGSGKLAEVYPAAALVAWGFEASGYKGADGQPKRTALVDALMLSTAGFLEISPEVKAELVRSDDSLDALVASLVARAAALALTLEPGIERLEQCRREGWIHLPNGVELRELSGGAIPSS